MILVRQKWIFMKYKFHEVPSSLVCYILPNLGWGNHRRYNHVNEYIDKEKQTTY